MPRPAQFDTDGVLDAALRVIASHGPSAVSIEAIATEMGGNVGSIYYRFPGKDHLLAQLWLRCAQRGEAGMIHALAIEDLDHAVPEAALHYPRWARTNLPEAQVLAAYGRHQLLPQWPVELAADLEAANRGLVNAVRSFGRRWFGEAGHEQHQVTTFALLDIPVAAIRRFLLAGKPPPVTLDPSIVAATYAALEQGSRRHDPRGSTM
jgi:AcrR family transcriptional regulator